MTTKIQDIPIDSDGENFKEPMELEGVDKESYGMVKMRQEAVEGMVEKGLGRMVKMSQEAVEGMAEKGLDRMVKMSQEGVQGMVEMEKVKNIITLFSISPSSSFIIL